MEISVIMLTYNRESMLSHMISCILEQTFSDFEYIIVDNGSTDRSGEIAEEYAKKDERIRVLHLPKSTIGRGRNAGLDAARGTYIAFVDDDDSCEANFLESLYCNITAEQADVAICGAAGKSFDVRQVYTREEALEVLLDRKYFNVGFPMKLIRKTLFEGNRFNEESRYDDIYLMPRILGAAGKIVYEGKPLYDCFRHPGNNSSWTTNFKLLTPETLSEYLTVYRQRTKWLLESFPDKREIWEYFEQSFWISMIDKVTRYEVTACYRIRERLVREMGNVKAGFLENPKTQEFEKEYIREYLK